MEWTKTANQDLEQDDLSLSATRQAFNETMDIVQEVFIDLAPEEMLRPSTTNSMGLAAPWLVLQIGIFDHTAHHRGTLAQYARMCGKEPRSPISKCPKPCTKRKSNVFHKCLRKE